jgi:ComF family protein
MNIAASMKRLNMLVRTLLDFIYPPHCAICEAYIDGGTERIVCPVCWGKVHLMVSPRCGRCGKTVETPVEVCPTCERWEHSFSRARTAARFEGVVQDLVHLMKYQGKCSIAKRLGATLADSMRDDSTIGQIDLLLPVPLHPSRERERGYNQSALIARALGEDLGIPVEERLLQRIRNTKTQTQLNAFDRAVNVAGAFRVKNPESVVGRSLALVDDVMTTGATADACASALIAAGASQVTLLVVASPVHQNFQDST